MAITLNEPNSNLNPAIKKIIWNHRSKNQSSIGCSPFSKPFSKQTGHLAPSGNP